MDKIRLDKYCAKQLGSRTKAQDTIRNGDVKVNGRTIKKSSYLVAPLDTVVIDNDKHAYVSRGAYKLLGAIDHWKIDISKQVVLDIGASTGGFTEVCLRHGADKIYALDVGHLQLSKRLASHPAVIQMEGRNARKLTSAWFADPIDFVCMDVSFISCKMILEVIFKELPSKHMVILIKPQFECGPGVLGAQGVLKDKEIRQKIVSDIVNFVALYYTFVDVIPSCIQGRSGNQEFVLYARERRSI